VIGGQRRHAEPHCQREARASDSAITAEASRTDAGFGAGSAPGTALTVCLVCPVFGSRFGTPLGDQLV
jgi:hypothetical protein